ncbi:hypothetical protein BAE44_0017961 [Dichanthelium oligosanthes]|uniref:Subtilisin inhibitor 1 n=1 Tax=Dichanthelium oligosanthes TaxID=888268 RepID=A0A1E5V775_9POAL|nr:hypothetical protein BAE44_0017961 [Dichanthelium oligosanthes]
MSDNSKVSWPELVGLPGEAAKEKILADRPDVQVFVMPEDSIVTADYNTKRVRVFVSKAGNVSKVPKIG